MKTKFSIAILILASGINLSFGNNATSRSVDQPVELRYSEELFFIAPVTPREAFFDEDMIGIEQLNSLNAFAPITPGEANFEESTTGTGQEIFLLAPVTPGKVDFNSETEEPVTSAGYQMKSISPATPVEADFNDNLVAF